jgi:uncharacterized Zn finger protein
MSEKPDCPKCGAAEKHVQLVIAIRDSRRQRVDWACNACGHFWSQLQGPEDRALH